MSMAPAAHPPTPLFATDAWQTQPAVAFSGTHTVEEWNDYLYFLGMKRGSWFTYAGGYLLFLPLAIWAAYHYFVPFPTGHYSPLFGVLFIWAMALLGTVGVPFFGWLAQRELQGKLDREESPFIKSTGNVSATGVTIRTNTSEESWNWDNFRACRTTPLNIFLTFRDAGKYVILSRSTFASQEDWETANQLVVSAFPRP